MLWIILLLGLSVSLLGSWVLCHLAPKLGLIDKPIARSMHCSPTPRGGGLAFMFSFLLILFGFYRVHFIELNVLLGFSLGGLIVGAVGLIDDFEHVSPTVRLLCHSSAALILLYYAHGLGPLNLGPFVWHWHALGWGIGVLGIVWLVNLYNFMDGIDGLAGGEALFVAASVALLLMSRGAAGMTWVWICLALIVAVAGFLAFNWPPARLFMGDVGSGFLGYSLAALLVFTTSEGLLTPWAFIILLAGFWVDTTVTLFRRWRRGSRLFEAHGRHNYQLMALFWLTPNKVLAGIMIINLMWLLPLALVCTHYPVLAIPATGIAIAPLWALDFIIQSRCGHYA